MCAAFIFIFTDLILEVISMTIFLKVLLHFGKGWKIMTQVKGRLGRFYIAAFAFASLTSNEKAISDLEKEKLANEAQMVDKDFGNAVQARNQMIFDVTGIKLKDEIFWYNVRAELTDNQWKWVDHYVISGLSIKEILKLENVTEGAVKSWARQTRRKLKTDAFTVNCIEVIGA